MTIATTTAVQQEDTIQPVLRQVQEALRSLEGASNVQQPNRAALRQRAAAHGFQTQFGSYAFGSMVKSRSAGLTVYVGSDAVQLPQPSARQQEILRQVPRTLELVHRYLRRAPLIRVQRRIGTNATLSPLCTSYISIVRPEMVRIGCLWGETLFDATSGVGPGQTVIYLPEWQEKDRQVLVFPEIHTAYVLGFDYIGEIKMGHLRQAMFTAKQQGLLGLHAGSKVLKARDAATGKLQRIGMIIFGLTATGKTTHSCHDHGLTGDGEGIEILQDDIVFFRPDGACLGTEQGFYLKTDGLRPDVQPAIYRAVTSPRALFENVLVDFQGQVDFADETLTSNGRAIVQREDLGKAGASVDLPPVAELDKLIVAFITRRNTVVPIAAKLTHEQAAAIFMLGESVESSGGDPRRAGESVREVGMNPFIIGDPTAEGNRFFELISRHPTKIECYLLNTGGVGELIERHSDGTKVVQQPVTRVQIPEMAAIIRNIARNSIRWEAEPLFGVQVPREVEGVTMDRFALQHFYSREQIIQLAEQLFRERVDFLQQFRGLDPRISAAITQHPPRPS